MSEPNDKITDELRIQPSDISAQPPRKSKTWRHVLFSRGGINLLLCCSMLAAAVGLLLPFVQKVREASFRATSQGNVKQMMLGVTNCCGNSRGGDIPPANGTFRDKEGSFFYHLLPYIEQSSLYAAPSDTPVKAYTAAGDARNPNTDSTISYCTNGTALSGAPTMPGSFLGRTSATVCIMERSGLDGAHKWTNGKTSLGSPGNPPPFPQIDAEPSNYLDGSPQGFTSAGCVVGFGDGHTANMNINFQNDWNWLCDPTNQGLRPPRW